jgi:hypothetical protein
VGLFLTLENLAGDALGSLLGDDLADVEPQLGVVLAELWTQPIAATRDLADAPPLAVTDLENFSEQLADPRARSR